MVMGPDRLSRSPVIDEHDFYAGEYLANDTPVQIKIEVTVIGLSEDQKIYFGNQNRVCTDYSRKTENL